MAFSANVDIAEATRVIQTLLSRFTPVQADAITRAVAYRTQAALRAATPRRWTGQTKRDWQVIERMGGVFSVENANPVARYLESGTRAHGPVTARALFIPLTRDAAVNGYRTGMRFGTDFVLSKWVRGIKAMHIAERQEPISLQWLRQDLEAYAKIALRI